MKARSRFILILLMLTVVNTILFSQSITLRGSSALELQLGLWSNANAGQQVSVLGVKQEAKASGFLGGLAYSYWMRENMAVTVTGSLLSSEATSTVTTFPISVKQNTNALFSLLVGLRYYLPEPEPEDMVRPFVAFGIGSYMGFEADNTLISQTAHSESTFGGRVGVGLDAFLGTSVKLGVNGGYNVMSDFRTAVGARNNLNGMDFSVGIAFLFGGNR